MKIYVTKYALSSGILAVEAEREEGHSYRKSKSASWGCAYDLWFAGDFKLTEAEALADAEARRVKKIASMRKLIEKLEKKTFKIKEG